MELKELAGQIKLLLTNPEKGWHSILKAGYSRQWVMGYYLIPMVFLANLANIFFLGKQQIEIDFTPGQLFFVAFASAVISIFISAYFIAALAPRFKGESNFDKTINLLAFAYSPVYLAAMIASLHEALQILNMAAMVFTIFLIYRGTGIFLNIPERKITGFTLISLIILFSTRIITAVFLAVVVAIFTIDFTEY